MLIAFDERIVLRCCNCRNRIGPEAARVLGDGLLVCDRCARRVQSLDAPGGSVQIVGE